LYVTKQLQNDFLGAYSGGEFNNEHCNCSSIQNFSNSLNYESNAQFHQIMVSRRKAIQQRCAKPCQ